MRCDLSIFMRCDDLGKGIKNPPYKELLEKGFEYDR